MISQLYSKFIINRYLSAGRTYGDMLSYYFMGEPVGFEAVQNRFNKLQIKVAKLGYLPYSLAQLVNYGGYGRELTNMEKNPSPFKLAKRLRENGLSAGELRELMTGPDSIIQSLYGKNYK